MHNNYKTNADSVRRQSSAKTECSNALLDTAALLKIMIVAILLVDAQGIV